MSVGQTQFPNGNYAGNSIYPNKVQGRGVFFRKDFRETTTVTVKQGQVLKAHTFLESDAAGKCIAHGPITEATLATFVALTSGQTSIAGGLTFTAGASGISAINLAIAWATADVGDTAAAATTKIAAAGITAAMGTFTAGTLAGWTTERSGTGAVVSFNSTATGTNATDLAFTGTGTAPALSKVEGSTSFRPIAGALLYDVDASAGDVNAAAYLKASFWADALVWAVNPAVDTVTSATDGVTDVPCTPYNTGCSGSSAASNLLKKKFVEGSEFANLGFTNPGEIYNG